MVTHCSVMVDCVTRMLHTTRHMPYMWADTRDMQGWAGATRGVYVICIRISTQIS